MRAAGAPWRYRGEILHSLAILGGWTLVSWGLASLLVWQAWPISGGLLLLSLAGWGHLRVVFHSGLYRLTRGKS